MFGKVSLASLGLVLGSLLTVAGFAAYALDYATLNLAGFFYGIPLLLGGLALKAAELKPIPYSAATMPEILRLREAQATPTQNQIRKDVTRYRYGQEAHLDEALQLLGLSPTDEERPVLTALRETALDGQYSLVLEFDSPYISLEKWQEKQEKIAKFFGPGIEVVLTPQGEKRLEVALVAEKQLTVTNAG
jgi:cellulose biosynthesis protein BcsQ